MKALSLKQPFAELIKNGTKTIETRLWSTKYRGNLLICASLSNHNRIIEPFYVKGQLKLFDVDDNQIKILKV